MNKLLQRMFLGLAAVSGVFLVLLCVMFRFQPHALMISKAFFVSLFCAGFFLVAAFKMGMQWKFRVFMVVFTLVLLELALQAAAWLGVLPGLNTKEKVPYARVYWTAEGHGNSIRNRYGWYYPTFDLAAPKRIAVVGDSMVEGIGVGRDRNFSFQLQQLLKKDSPDWAVLGLGCHGTAPAYYLDVLEYVAKHFPPQEVIVCISLGSDIVESVPALNGGNPAGYIYYDVDEHGQLTLNPASAERRESDITGLEFSHQPCYRWLPALIKSHCMTAQSFVSIRDALVRRRLKAERAAAMGAATNDLAARDFAELGFNRAPFALNPGPEIRHAMVVLEAEIARCQEICDSHGIRLRLVTLPVFPSVFYETQKGRDWTMKIGDYDYLGPERELAAWAGARNIPVLPLGECIQSKKLDVEEIRGMYYSHGTGHFTEQGHRFCAGAIYDAFYAAKRQ